MPSHQHLIMPSSLLLIVFTMIGTSLILFTLLIQQQLGIRSTFALQSTNSGNDVTQYVNPFIGTEHNMNSGNVFPGAAIPMGMAKVGIDVDVFAPSGYISNLDNNVTGMSLLHDSGIGVSGGYGTFASFPVRCANNDVKYCAGSVSKSERKQKRNPSKPDIAKPGYFSTTLQDGTMLEATTTRRSALIRYTWNDFSKPFVSFDWTQDLSDTFKGVGHVDVVQNKATNQILLNGTFGSTFADPQFSNQVFACYDLNFEGKQEVDQIAMWSVNQDGKTSITPDKTNADANDGNQSRDRGVLISWKKGSQKSGNTQILLRAGISFVSAQQACTNAIEEIPDFDFDKVAQQAKSRWQEKLSRIQLDPKTDPNIVKLFYSSLYRGFLTPHNATNEGQGLSKGTPAPYFDGLYCTFDTFRTYYPLLSLTSAQDYAEIVRTYIDGWQKAGFIPECRCNNEPGYTQGGSDGTNVLADFAVKYRNANLNVNIVDLYAALYHDATTDSKTFNNGGGRQIGVFEKYGYIPSDFEDPQVQGLQRFQSSRTAEYAFNDFGIRNVALMLGKKDDADRWTKRSLNYRNVYDHTVKSLGFQTFMQKRKMDGKFDNQDPNFCSPADNDPKHDCFYDDTNNFGLYESSSWEYSLFAPHDYAGLISLISENSTENFIKRLDTFFDHNFFRSDDEPGFQTPLGYHYANAPTKSVDRVRQIVLNEFNLTAGGIPGNDDGGAMATLVAMHLLGLYPVPSTKEFLIVSPFMPSYTLHNTLFGNVTINADGFDPSTIIGGKPLTETSKAYVKTVKINGKQQSSRCKISFDQLFPAATSKSPTPQNTQITFEMGTKDEVKDCGPSPDDVPSSMSTGGFSTF